MSTDVLGLVGARIVSHQISLVITEFESFDDMGEEISTDLAALQVMIRHCIQKECNVCNLYLISACPSSEIRMHVHFPVSIKTIQPLICKSTTANLLPIFTIMEHQYC